MIKLMVVEISHMLKEIPTMENSRMTWPMGKEHM